MGLQRLIEEKLKLLEGLPLSIARRAADLAVFHFGKIQQVERGIVGDVALHVQCPWRIEGPEGILTGRSDLREPSTAVSERAGFTWENWKYDDGNLQDERIHEWLKGRDPVTGSAMNATGELVVTATSGDRWGGAVIELSGGYRLVLFPSGTSGEHWRLFRPDDAEHFVVE